MPEINYLAVLVAGAASFVASGVWYAVLGDKMVALQRSWRGAEPSESPQLWQMGAFFGSALVLAFTVAFIFGLADISGLAASVGLGLLLWVGFAATQWVGSILGEDVPLKLGAIHAGDWLAHMLIISAIVGRWR